MKLILCRRCEDVFKLDVRESRTCKCGYSAGQYEKDGLHAWYSGDFATPLGMSNHSLGAAMAAERHDGFPDSGLGIPFDAFVCPPCHTFVKVDKKPDDVYAGGLPIGKPIC